MSHRMVLDAVKATAEGRPVINNYPALRLACRRLNLCGQEAELPFREDAHVGIESTDPGVKTRGYEVQLRGWQKRAYFDTDSGNVFYDNWGGRWGNIQELYNLEAGYTSAVVDITRDTLEETATMNGDQFRILEDNADELVLEIVN